MLKLGLLPRISIIRRLLEVIYSAGSEFHLKSAAQARLQKLFLPSEGIEIGAAVASAVIRASEDFIALRYCTSPAQVLEWAKQGLPCTDTPASHMFGIVCAQACLTHLIDDLFADPDKLAEEAQPAAALCDTLSIYRESCQHFFVGQVLRRFGVRALCRLASHRLLRWLKGYVDPAMLLDRADLFLVHGAIYSQLRDQQLLHRGLDPSSDSAVSLLAIFNDATTRALETAGDSGTADFLQPMNSATGPPSVLSSLTEQAPKFLSGSSCDAVILALLERVQSNSLGGVDAGLHRAVLTVASSQAEAGALLHQLLLHSAVAAAHGGALAQPLRDLLTAPALMSARFVPAAPSFEDQRAAMQGTAGVTRWYVCPNGHPYAVGDCGRFSAGGRCICGAAIGGVRGYGTEQATDLAPPNLAEDVRGFPRAVRPLPETCRILSEDAAAQQRGWTQPVQDRGGAQRGLTASAAAALRVLMHVLLLAGAATCRRRAIEAANLIHLDVDTTGDCVSKVLEALTELLCGELVCLRQILGCSPEDTAVLLHCACQRIIDTARAEPRGGGTEDFNLATSDGRSAWENAFARLVLSPILEAVEATTALHRPALGSARSSHRQLRALLSDSENSLTGRTWAYRVPVTLDLCHRCLERTSTDPHHLPVLRGFLSSARLLRQLRVLLPIARFCGELCARYGRATMTFAEARALRIGDVLSGPDGAGLASGVAAFRTAWAGLQDQLHALVPTAVASFLARVVAAPSEHYGLGGGTKGYCLLDDDTPLTFFLPDETREGVCALALLVGLTRVHNTFLEGHRTVLLEQHDVRVDPMPLPLSRVVPSDVVGCRLRSQVLPLLLANAEHADNSGVSAGAEAVLWDMEGLERALVKACVVGRRILDEASVPRAVFVGRICDATALDRLRAMGMGRCLPRELWRPVLAELLARSEVVAALSAVETAASFLAAAPAVNCDARLTDYLHDILLMPAGAPLVGGSGTAQQLVLGHVLELRSRLDLLAALQQLDGGVDPFDSGATAEQGRLGDTARALVEAWARRIGRRDADRLLLNLRELLTARLSTLQPEWFLRDALVAYLDITDSSTDAEGTRAAAEALPDDARVLVREGGHVWRVLALLWLDDYLVPNCDTQATASEALPAGPDFAATALKTSLDGREVLGFSIQDLTCSVGDTVEHPAHWHGPSCSLWDSVEVLFRPPLPAGLTFARGAVRGQAATPQRRCVHVASAKGMGWARAAHTEVVLTVLPAAPPPFSYSRLVCTAGMHFGTLVPRLADGSRLCEDAMFTVVPALPQGLVLNLHTGEIGGIAGRAEDEGCYVVTCSSEGGSTEARLSLVVLNRAPGRFRYAALQCVEGAAVSPHIPIPLDDGPLSGAGITYSVAPPLPLRLELDPLTGVVTGTPAAAEVASWPQRTQHRISARSSCGKATATLEVEIRRPKDALHGLRQQLLHGSASWASEEWVFTVDGATASCRMTLSGLRVTSVRENPAALPGQKLYERFLEAYRRAGDKRVALCFHGTAAGNIAAICAAGLDPARRRGQSMGPGEYFAREAGVALPFCRQGRDIVLFVVLLEAGGLTADNGNVLVVHRSDHQLPLAVVSFA